MPIDFDTVSPWKDRKRVALDSTGTVVGIHSATNTDEWENPDDVSATYKEVDDSVDWSAYESAGLNCMVQVPKFWYKQYKDTDGWHFMISHPGRPRITGAQDDPIGKCIRKSII